MGTGTVAQNVSLLARYVSPVKKSESSRKELSGFFVSLLEFNRVEKRTKVRELEPPETNSAILPVTYGFIAYFRTHFLKFLRQFLIRIFINIHFTEISFALHFHNELIY